MIAKKWLYNTFVMQLKKMVCIWAKLNMLVFIRTQMHFRPLNLWEYDCYLTEDHFKFSFIRQKPSILFLLAEVNPFFHEKTMGIMVRGANKKYFMHYLSRTSQIVSLSRSELKTSITVSRNCHFQIFALKTVVGHWYSCKTSCNFMQEEILIHSFEIQISKN